MANIGDTVEIAFLKATPEEIRLRPNTYQLEPDIGEVVSDPFTDDYGVQYNMVRVNGRLRKVLAKKLKVINGLDGASSDTTERDEEDLSRARYFGEIA